MLTNFLHSINEHLLLLGLLSFIVLPSIGIMGYGFYLGTIISIFLGFVCFFKYRSKKIKINNLFILLFSLTFVIIFCNLNGYLSFDYGFNKGDFTEIIKYIQFLPYLLFASLCNNNKLYSLSKKYLYIAFFIIITIGFIQIFKIPILFDLVSSLYLNFNKASQLVNFTNDESLYRIMLTGSDPNIGAIISLFCFIYSITSIKNNKSIVNYINSIIFFIFIILGQSRTVLIALLFSISIYIILLSKANIKKRIFLLFAFIMSLLFFVKILNTQYIIVGFNTLSTGKNNSFNQRIVNIYNAYNVFQKSPILGLGVCKNHLPTIMDCEYASILQRFGLIGIFTFITIIMLLFATSLKKQYTIFSFPLTILTISSIIIMCTNNIFSGYQIFSIYILLYILSIKTNC